MHTAASESTSPSPTLRWSASQSIQRSSEACSGVGSSTLGSRTPGIDSSSPANCSAASGPCRRRIGRITCDLSSCSHIATSTPADSSAGRCCVAASTAALIAPTDVPAYTVGRCPRRSSSGRSSDSAPASYAPARAAAGQYEGGAHPSRGSAMRFTLRRSRCPTLFVVLLPPQVPQPSVSVNGRPVAIPQHPCAAGTFTSTRLAGILSA